MLGATLHVGRLVVDEMAFLSEQHYQDAMEECHSYNARLCAERLQRLPFLDSQTGVAQTNSSIWMEKHQRGPGLAPGQWYSYPARRWQKKRQAYLLEDPLLSFSATQPNAKETPKKEGAPAQAGSSSKGPARAHHPRKRAARDPKADEQPAAPRATKGRPRKSLKLQQEDEDWMEDRVEEKPKAKAKRGRGKAKAKGKRGGAQ